MGRSSGGIHAESGGLKHSNHKATLASGHSRVAIPSAKQMNNGDGISRRRSTTTNKAAILAVLAFSLVALQSSVMQISPWRCSSSTMGSAKTESAIFEGPRSSPIVEHTPKEKKNRLVLHFGPPKTATTTVQADLVELRNKQILASDHYWDSGLECLKEPFTDQQLQLCSIEQLFHIWALHEPYTEYRNQLAQKMLVNSQALASITDQAALGSSWQPPPPRLPAPLVETQRVLDVAKEQNISLVYSSEFQGEFWWFDKTRFQSPTYFNNLRHFLEDWDVSVVVTYRRAFDWMLSAWKQIVGMEAEEGKPSIRWPMKGGVINTNTWTIIREYMTPFRIETYVFADF